MIYIMVGVPSLIMLSDVLLRHIKFLTTQTRETIQGSGERISKNDVRIIAKDVAIQIARSIISYS